jgi:hypothetical protein
MSFQDCKQVQKIEALHKNINHPDKEFSFEFQLANHQECFGEQLPIVREMNVA